MFRGVPEKLISTKSSVILLKRNSVQRGRFVILSRVSWG